VHPLQATQGFQIQGFAAYRQILPFDQREAKVAGQVGVFKISFVVWPGCQQHDMRLLVAFDRGQCIQAILLVAEEIGQVLDMQVAEHFREDARNDQPVFQRVTGPGGGLRPVGNNPPATVRRTRQIDRILVQPGTTGRLDTLTGPEIAVLTIDQGRRQQAFGKQFLLTVKIGQDRIQQGGSLGHGSRDLGPFFGRNDQR